VELLYLIDRTITRAIQAFSKGVESRLRISLDIQRHILYFVGIALGSMVSSATDRSVDSTFLTTGAYMVVFFLGWMLMNLAVAVILLLLHVFIDREGATARDKLYESRYLSWSSVVVSAAYLIIGFTGSTDAWKDAMIFTSLPMGLFLGYAEFAKRRRGSKRQDKQKVSAALQALIERCRDWLPIPKPAPQQG